MRRLSVVAIALVLAIGTVTGFAAVAAAKTSATATVKVRGTKLGRVLVDAKGRTLYLFEKDKGSRSACAGACAQAWPPLLTQGRPKAAGGAHAAMLGTTRRSDGTTQVTYHRHPLYRFVLDHNKPGSTKGEGSTAFGAEWYVVGANGNKIEEEGGS